MKSVLSIWVVAAIAILAVVGALNLGDQVGRWLTGWPPVPESGWNDHYDGRMWKVVKTIPAHEIVDQAKLKELGGEEVYFFTRKFAYPTDQEVYCVILRHPSRGVQIGE